VRLRFLLLSLLLVIGCLGGMASAQGTTTFCGTLSTADCALLNESTLAMAAVESAAFHFDMTMGLDGLPGMDFGLRIVGDGAFAVDPEQAAVLGSAQSALQDDPAKLGALMEAAVRSLSADASVIIEIPESLARSMSTRSQLFPTRIPFELRLVDGIGYINLDKIAALNHGGSTPSGWYGLDVAAFYRTMFEEQAGLYSSPFGNTGSGFTNSGFDSKYMDITRLANTEIETQTMGVFQTDFDFGALLNDPIMRDALRLSMMESLGTQGSDSLADQDEMVNTVIALLETMTMSMSQMIGLDDKYLHNFKFNLDWRPDMKTLAELTGEPSASLEMFAFNFNFDLSVDLHRFNEAAAATAPEDATIIPLNMLVPFMTPGDRT
jgi:hypothetical protein